MLTTHPLLVPRLRKRGTIPPLIQSASIACNGTTFLFLDLLHRSKLSKKLEEISKLSHEMTNASEKIVACKYMTITARQNNSVRPMEYSKGTTGISLFQCHNDRCSPRHPGGKYKHILSPSNCSSSQDLQTAFNEVIKWAETNNLQDGKEKAEMVIFRKGAKVEKIDYVQIEKDKINIASSHKYLGIALQTCGTFFSIHTRERKIAATKAIYVVRRIRLLSLEHSSETLHIGNCPNFDRRSRVNTDPPQREKTVLESVKAVHLKRVPQVSKYVATVLLYCERQSVLRGLRINLQRQSTWLCNRAGYQ
jgi:hypothetical protein